MGHLDILLQQLKSGNLHDQLEAIRTLRRENIKDPRVVEALIEALQNPENDPFVHEDAAEALGEIGNPMAIQPLIEAFRDLNEDNSYVWLKAACALLRIGGPEVFACLLEALQNEDPCIRAAAAHTLWRIKDRRAVEPLIKVLNEQENQDVRRRAAWALGEIGDPRATRALVRALVSKDSVLRRFAAEALEKIGGPQAEEALLAALERGDLHSIAGAYRFFLQKGLPGSEKILLEVLQKFGDDAMAQAFLNSGHPELEKEVREWAQ